MVRGDLNIRAILSGTVRDVLGFAVRPFGTRLRQMKKLVYVVGVSALILSCQARHSSNQTRETASRAAENERARKNAEQDALQAERQRNVVEERSKDPDRNPPKN